MKAPFGTDTFQPRITGCMTGMTAPAERDLDFESMPPLVVSNYPEVREPADPSATPVPAVAPVVFNGRIDPPGDEDRFLLAVTPGSRVRIKVQAYELGSSLDAVLRVEGKGGSSIANADDQTIPLPPKNGMPQSLIIPDPIIETTVPSGTNEIAVVIRDLERRGGVGFPYRIVAEPLNPDFEIAAGATEVSVPRGSTAAVGVTVKRKGYTGPIAVTVDHPPAGLTVRPGTIAAGQAAGVLTLTASADAAFPAAPIRLRRTRPGHGRPDRASGRRARHLRQAIEPADQLDHRVRTGRGARACDARDARRRARNRSRSPRDSAPSIPVKVARTKGSDGALAVSGLVLPPGVTVPGDPIADKATEGKVRVQAALEAPLGISTLALQAKGKLGGADRTIIAPAVTLAVVRPAAARARRAGRRVEARGDGRGQGPDRPERHLQRAGDRPRQRPAGRAQGRSGDRRRRLQRFRREDRRRSEGSRGDGRSPGRPGVPGQQEGLPGPPDSAGDQGPAPEMKSSRGRSIDLRLALGELPDVPCLLLV